MESNNFTPVESPTRILSDRFMCMDERVLLETVDLIKEFGTDDIETYQAPGGDGFYPVLRDVIQEASATGTVKHGIDHSFREVFSNLQDEGHRPAVHNDDHGQLDTLTEYDGCGFLGRLEEILKYAADNVEKIISDTGANDEQAKRMRSVALAAGRLANPEYVNKSGAELVQLAVTELGAHLWTVTGEHDARGVLRNKGGGTHHVKKAHSSGNPRFNVDSPPVKEIAETKLGLNPEDTEAVLDLLTVAAVDVLKPGSEVETRE